MSDLRERVAKKLRDGDGLNPDARCRYNSWALRESMVEAIREPYPEDIFIPPPDIWGELHQWAKERGTTLDAISADTVRKLVGVYAAGRILRAIVDELGVTWDNAVDLLMAIVDHVKGEPLSDEDREELSALASRIATLLEAAGVER